MIARSLRGVVDWSALRKAMAGASLTEPALAVRAAREAVKVEKAEDLFRLTRDVGRVQTKAGTRAALDGLKIADNPREMARVAKLAEIEGRQDPRHPEIPRPRRDRADGRGVRSCALDFVGGVDGVRLCVVDQGRGRARDAGGICIARRRGVCEKRSSTQRRLATARS